MSNPSFVSGRVKIGKSDRDPERYRKDELETTGVPEPFHVEYFALVEDHDGIERALHKKFAEQRVRSSREFFDAPINIIVEEIYRITKVFYEKKNYKDPNLFKIEDARKTIKNEIESQQLTMMNYLCMPAEKPTEFFDDIVNYIKYNSSQTKFGKFVIWMRMIEKEHRETFDYMVGYFCDTIKKYKMSTIIGFFMREIRANSNNKFYGVMIEMRNGSAYQLQGSVPSFSSGMHLISRVREEFVVFWDDKERCGSWYDCTKSISLSSYREFYNWNPLNRELSICHAGRVLTKLTVPNYLDVDKRGLLFNPDAKTKIRLRCISQINGIIQITIRGGSNSNLDWEKIPNCKYIIKNILVEEKGFLGMKKLVPRELKVPLYMDQNIDQKWVSEICRGWIIE